MGFERVSVAKMEEVPPGSSRLVTVDGREVALFNVGGRFYAIGNRCPHRSGPLVRGQIEKVSEGEEGSTTLAVRCPIHGWLFELATGRGLTRDGASTPFYPVTCERGEICLGAAQGESVGPSKPVSIEPGGMTG